MDSIAFQTSTSILLQSLSALPVGSELQTMWRISYLLFLSWNLIVIAEQTDNLLDVATLRQFIQKLPDLPRIKAYKLTDAALSIGMHQIKWKFHPDLPATTVFAYGHSKNEATVPGPVIMARRGIETHVQWENHLPEDHILPIDRTIAMASPKSGVPTVVHLHGSLTEPESDGNSNAWFTANFEEKGPTWSKKTYVYSNIQLPGTLWYHDHAMGLTRANILAGLSGVYVLEDPQLEKPFKLPSGSNYDKILLICDKAFYRNGSIYMSTTGNNPEIHPEWNPEYFGDVIIVNGKAWPYLKVRRRKYRFRLVNGSNARFFRLALSNGLRMTQIGSDAYYLPRPVLQKQILLAPSEIADFIIDFAECAGQEIILTNSAVYPFPEGDPVNGQNGHVMKFIVDHVPTKDSSTVPKVLIPLQKLKVEDVAKTRYITMFEYESSTEEPTHLLLNGLKPESPATETPASGSTELWQIINLTDDNHPLHIHLAGFQVMSEQKLRDVDELKDCLQKEAPEQCNVWSYVKGQAKAAPKNERGWKNVYKMKPSHITSFLIRFSTPSGKPFPFNVSSEPGYVYHCHILDHEDNQMMRPLKILP